LSTKFLVLLLLLVPSFAPATDPIVAVWYRGNPVGVPQQSDLGAIRALGFNAVVWPAVHEVGLAQLYSLAARVGLKVISADKPRPITGSSALKPPARVDIAVTSATGPTILALAWRAVAHGGRVIAFDGGMPAGAGLEETDRSLKPWVRTAINIARALTANANLAGMMRSGPRVSVTPKPAGLDVAMLDADRAWVIVATNTSSNPIKAEARLPKGTPYALWVSWLEGPPLAMVSESSGPRWVLSLEPYGAQVYIIDKKMK